MVRTAKGRVDWGCYSLVDVAARIEALRRAREVPVPVIAAAIWPLRGAEARYDWYKKVKHRSSAFSVDEIGRICRYFAAPVPWPWVDLVSAEAFQAMNGKLGPNASTR